MVMTYTSLVAPKGTTGSLANWVNYTKLDLPTILDEAQSLLFQMLRVREMLTEWTFALAVGESEKALPERFLDPASDIYLMAYGLKVKPTFPQHVTDRRFFDNTLAGALGADPFATTAGSSLVQVTEADHLLTQGSTLTIAGATSVGGLTLNGAFPVVSLIDDDTLVIDAGAAADATATGGGAAATYGADKLIEGCPSTCALWDEKIKFDVALDQASSARVLMYRAPALLSASNQSNWLTNRYPKLLRVACQAAAADFMKDSEEYTKCVTALQGLIQSTSAENDLQYRGASLGTDNPDGR